MKIKTSELTGPALDWAVAECAGIPTKLLPTKGHTLVLHKFSGEVIGHSRNWAQGGPIIEREGISIGKADDPDWWAFKGWKAEDGTPGPTPLIAAMRCYVASQLGDEVEVPDELLA
jgi:hypothetical protein